MFLTLLDFSNQFTVSILRMFWWELVHHMTNNSILKWGPTSSIWSSLCHHVKNKVFNVLCPNWGAHWGRLTSSYGVSDRYKATLCTNEKCWGQNVLVQNVGHTDPQQTDWQIHVESILFLLQRIWELITILYMDLPWTHLPWDQMYNNSRAVPPK